MTVFPYRLVPALATCLVLACAPAGDASDGPLAVEVRSDAQWQPSAVHVAVGQRVTITAVGEYVFHTEGHTSGAAGIPEAAPFSGAWPAPELTGLALVGRIGPAGEPFLVGESVELTAAAPGELMFMVNDDIVSENEGTLTVTIALGEPPPTPSADGEAPGDDGAPAASGEEPAASGVATGDDASGTQARVLEIASVGLRMEIPDDWSEGGVSGETVLASFAGGSGLQPGLNITLENHDGAGPAAVTDSWLGLLPDPTVAAREERDVSGRPAVFTDVSWNSLLGSLRAMRLIIGRGDDVLVVTFVDKGNDVTDEVAAAYRAYLDSVTLETPE